MNYYQIRTLVRFVFWGTVLFLAGTGCGKLAEMANPTDDNPCAVNVNRDFTWTTNAPLNIDLCDHPEGIMLFDDGHWEWDYEG